MRKLVKSSDTAHTQGLRKQSCHSSAHTVRLRAHSAANSTMDKSCRRVNWYAAPPSSTHRGRASPMNTRYIRRYVCKSNTPPAVQAVQGSQASMVSPSASAANASRAKRRTSA